MLAANWPILDKDAPKIDSDPHSFKSVTIDRSSFHQFGGSSRSMLRALSLHDWFIGLAGLHFDDKALYTVQPMWMQRLVAPHSPLRSPFVNI